MNIHVNSPQDHQETSDLSKQARLEVELAEKLSNAGKHEDALHKLKQLMHEGGHSRRLQTALGWALYSYCHAELKKDAPNHTLAENLLLEYLTLTKVDKPSHLHTCQGYNALKLGKQGGIHLGSFVILWGLDKLRFEDYKIGNAREVNYMSFAEQIIHYSLKDAIYQKSTEQIAYILPYAENILETSVDPVWSKYYLAKAYLLLGKAEQALHFGKKFVMFKSYEYWSWELLGDINSLLANDNDIALACYGKSLTLSNDLNSVIFAMIKISKLLICRGEHARAKCVIQEVVKHRIKTKQYLFDEVVEIIEQPWYETTKAVVSNQQYYDQLALSADEFLFGHLPWRRGVLGATYHSSSSYAKVLLVVELPSLDTPVETTTVESNIKFEKRDPGTGIRVKGDLDEHGLFQAYVIEPRETEIEWDLTPVQIGVVDHINKRKKFLHIIVDRNVDALIPFAKLNRHKYKIGDAIAVRISKYITASGSTGHNALTVDYTDEPPPKTIMTPFEGEIEINGTMGFIDMIEFNVYVTPWIVEYTGIEDGTRVKGKAVISYDKKRAKWGWKALYLSRVD